MRYSQNGCLRQSDPLDHEKRMFIEFYFFINATFNYKDMGGLQAQGDIPEPRYLMK